MDPLLYVGLEKMARRNRNDWSRRPSGFGRLLAAMVIISLAIWFLDSAAIPDQGTSIASFQGSSQQGR